MKKKIIITVIIIAIILLGIGAFFEYKILFPKKELIGEESVKLEEIYVVDNEEELTTKLPKLEDPLELEGEIASSQTKYTFEGITFGVDKDFKLSNEEEDAYYLNLRNDDTFDAKVVLSKGYDYTKSIIDTNGEPIGIENEDIDVKSILKSHNITNNKELFYGAIEEMNTEDANITTEEEYQYHLIMARTFSLVVPNMEFKLIDSPFLGYYKYFDEDTIVYELHIFGEEEYVLSLWNGEKTIFNETNMLDFFNTVKVLE
jgi:hypothetical protein